MPAHAFDDLSLCQAKLRFNRLKRRPVFPGHFDDAIPIRGGVQPYPRRNALRCAAYHAAIYNRRAPDETPVLPFA
jgi:hypothetical protein